MEISPSEQARLFLWTYFSSSVTFLTNAPGGYVLYNEPKQVYVINVTE